MMMICDMCACVRDVCGSCGLVRVGGCATAVMCDSKGYGGLGAMRLRYRIDELRDDDCRAIVCDEYVRYGLRVGMVMVRLGVRLGLVVMLIVRL